MNDEALLYGLAAVLAGIATLEFVLGVIYSPALLAVAVPFGAAAYLVWYQASGRLRERVQQGRAGDYRRQAEVGSETGGFGAGARDADRRSAFDAAARRVGFGARRARSAGRGRDGRREAGGPRGAGRAGAAGRADGAGRAGRGGFGPGAGGARGVGRNDGPTPREAYRVLDLDPGADEEAVRRAYREKVKSVHPDREGGDEEAFKRVNEAYEVLKERS